LSLIASLAEPRDVVKASSPSAQTNPTNHESALILSHL